MLRFPVLRALVLVLVVGSLAQAQPPAVLGADSFFQMESIANPQISPDGTQVVFSRGFVDTMKDQNASRTCGSSTCDGERLRQLTDGAWRDSAPGVVAGRQAHRVPLEPVGHDPDPRDVARHARDRAAHAPRARAERRSRWSPDGTQIAFTIGAARRDAHPAREAAAVARRARNSRRARSSSIARRGARTASARPPRATPTSSSSTPIVGGTPRQVTTGNYNHSAPEWSADGKTLYVSGIRKPDAEYLRGDSEIYAVDLDDARP